MNKNRAMWCVARENRNRFIDTISLTNFVYSIHNEIFINFCFNVFQFSETQYSGYLFNMMITELGQYKRKCNQQLTVKLIYVRYWLRDGITFWTFPSLCNIEVQTNQPTKIQSRDLRIQCVLQLTPPQQLKHGWELGLYHQDDNEKSSKVARKDGDINILKVEE